MKWNLLRTLVLLMAVSVQTGLAQESADQPEIVVPLSDPGRPVSLYVAFTAGSIEVIGDDRDDVVVRTRSREERRRVPTVDGMHRIANTSVGLTVEEQDNSVRVTADWSNRGADVQIRVPRRTSARVSTVNHGEIEVRGLNGELELQNTNGGIEALEIRGSVVANTTNGSVKVTLLGIDRDKPMAFNTLNGDVDVTFPPDLRADVRINAGRGEILTDFEAEVQPTAPKVERTPREEGYRVRLEREVHVKIGGGGPTYRFRTLNGDVKIRKGGV